MKKVISILLVLVICLSLTVTAYATNDGFVSSPGEDGTPCMHGQTVLSGAIAASCTGAGYTGDLVCSVCGEVIEKGTVIPALAHTFNEDGVCTVCGAKDVPKTGDSSNMILWAGLMLVSAAAIVTVVSVRRKKA